MAGPKTPAVTHPAPPVPQTPAPESDAFSFEVGDYATGKHRATSKVPDAVADLLEDLRDAHAKDVTDAKGTVIPAGTVKFKTVTLPHEEAGERFAKHVRSYSKTVMYPDWSARLSQLSPTTYRVGVGPVKPKPRKARVSDAEVIDQTTANAAQRAGA